jgi:hypothetical protein
MDFRFLFLLALGVVVAGCVMPGTPMQSYDCKTNLTCFAYASFQTCGPARVLVSHLNPNAVVYNTTVYAEVRKQRDGYINPCELYIDIRDMQPSANAPQDVKDSLARARANKSFAAMRTECVVPHDETPKFSSADYFWSDELAAFCTGPIKQPIDWGTYTPTPQPTYSLTPVPTMGPVPTPGRSPDYDYALRAVDSLEIYSPKDLLFVGNESGLYLATLLNQSRSSWLPVKGVASVNYQGIRNLKLRDDYLFAFNSRLGFTVQQYFESNNTVSPVLAFSNPVSSASPYSFIGDGEIEVDDWNAFMLDRGGIFHWKFGGEYYAINYRGYLASDRYRPVGTPVQVFTDPNYDNARSKTVGDFSAILDFGGYLYAARPDELRVYAPDLEAGTEPVFTLSLMSYQRLGRYIITDFAADSDTLYLASTDGVHVLDISDRETPTILKFVPFTGTLGGKVKLVLAQDAIYAVGNSTFGNNTVLQVAMRSQNSILNFTGYSLPPSGPGSRGTTGALAYEAYNYNFQSPLLVIGSTPISRVVILNSVDRLARYPYYP